MPPQTEIGGAGVPHFWESGRRWPPACILRGANRRVRPLPPGAWPSLAVLLSPAGSRALRATASAPGRLHKRDRYEVSRRILRAVCVLCGYNFILLAPGEFHHRDHRGHRVMPPQAEIGGAGVLHFWESGRRWPPACILRGANRRVRPLPPGAWPSLAVLLSPAGSRALRATASAPGRLHKRDRYEVSRRFLRDLCVLCGYNFILLAPGEFHHRDHRDHERPQRPQSNATPDRDWWGRRPAFLGERPSLAACMHPPWGEPPCPPSAPRSMAVPGRAFIARRDASAPGSQAGEAWLRPYIHGVIFTPGHSCGAAA